jgi:thiamine transport system substrate-binding protein
MVRPVPYGTGNLIRVMPAEGVMMKTRLYTSFFIVSLLISIGGLFASGKSEPSQAGSAPKEVVVYAYDSFTADWGPGPELVKRFEAQTGYTVTLLSCGDAAQVLSRAVLEKKTPGADVLVGIDNNLVDAARKAGVLDAYKPKNADSLVAKEHVLADDWLLTPYDWGYFAFMFDTASALKPPASLEDLADPRFAKKIILMDPRSSTPGTGFLAWTLAVYGKDYLSYWGRIKGNILTLAPGWDTGYGLFTSGEAPLVISYTTSAAYHVEYDKTDRYQALVFEQGHIAQIEGLGLVKGAKNPEGAKAFIDFMLTDAAQETLPLTQWMYPVSKTVKLPESYKASPKAGKTLSVKASDVPSAVDQVISVLTK